MFSRMFFIYNNSAFAPCRFLSVSISATAVPEVAVAAVAKHVSGLFYFFLCKEQRVVGVRHQPLTLCHLIQTH